MNKTYEVVKAWAEFEEQYPSGNIEDFCRHFLTHQKSKKKKSDEELCNDCASYFDLSRTINQLSRLWMHFSQNAIRVFNLSNFDEFVFLYTVNAIKDIRKKDLIYIHLIEISSGLLIIDRLIKKGMLKEMVDKNDKRSRLLSITQKGKEVLARSRAVIDKVALEMYTHMPEDDMLLCIQLLLPIEKLNAQKWHQVKGFELQLPE